VTREFRVCSTVEEELFRRKCAFESREDVLGSNTVACAQSINQRRSIESNAQPPIVCAKEKMGLTSFIENDGVVLLRVVEETEKDTDFGDSVIGTTCDVNLSTQSISELRVRVRANVCCFTCVTTDSTTRTSSSEEDDSIAKKLNVRFEIRLLLFAQSFLARIQAQSMWDERYE
jgi:hypothetical protein